MQQRFPGAWAGKAGVQLDRRRKVILLSRVPYAQVVLLVVLMVSVTDRGWLPSSSVRASTRTARQEAPLLRVVTYNVHSCKGLDSRVRPDRIADILRHTDADVIALQEVRAGQAAEIARQIQFNLAFAQADIVHGYEFGNAILTRYPMRETHVYPLGVPGRQQRACLRADIAWPRDDQLIHVFTVHLGLSKDERREQASRLASGAILLDPNLQHVPRLLLGDFNEKAGNGAVNQQLSPLLRRVGRKTWPSILPLVGLDRLYLSSELKVRSVHVFRSPGALIASDHIPLTAILEIER